MGAKKLMIVSGLFVTMVLVLSVCANAVEMHVNKDGKVTKMVGNGGVIFSDTDDQAPYGG